MSRIIFKFEKDINRYSAKNGKIDDIGLKILEERYGDKGYSFYNEDDEAIMEWSGSDDEAFLFSARLDFEGFIVHS